MSRTSGHQPVQARPSHFLIIDMKSICSAATAHFQFVTHRYARMFLSSLTRPNRSVLLYGNTSHALKLNIHTSSIACAKQVKADVGAEHTLVVVESPAKAVKIQRYLGRAYKVIASNGHVRDLPSRAGAVKFDGKGDVQLTWQITPTGEKQLNMMQLVLEGNPDYKWRLILATDPDREGEAIAWHVLQSLQTQKALPANTPVARVRFNQITEQRVLEAIANPTELAQPLVDAYFARRALDHLLGFTISPLLWKKLSGAKSAGRVQSVALRLLCDREASIEQHLPQVYWTVQAALKLPNGAVIPASVVDADKRSASMLKLHDLETANEFLELLAQGSRLTVGALHRAKATRQPPPPFTTSTLQQEASQKLRWSAATTMQVAQKLYEGPDDDDGVITYIRTDSITLSEEGKLDGISQVRERFGEEYLPTAVRVYNSKAVNAQEAHEAIRPISAACTPSDLSSSCSAQLISLYQLIWQRTLASLMNDATYKRVAAHFVNADASIDLRSTGSYMTFAGWRAVYRRTDGQDDTETEADDMDEAEKDTGDLSLTGGSTDANMLLNTGDIARQLEELKRGSEVEVVAVKLVRHETQPPPRYTEGTLVKHMEELGVGRPSTYATILQTLKTRKYALHSGHTLFPSPLGRVVDAYLKIYATPFVQHDYTANMEKQLDQITAGKVDWKVLVKGVNEELHKYTEPADKVSVMDVVNKLNETLGQQLMPDGSARHCPSCNGELVLRLSKSVSGVFIGCSAFPLCNYMRPAEHPTRRKCLQHVFGDDNEKVLGMDMSSNLEVLLRRGSPTCYVQLGRYSDGYGGQPKQVAVPQHVDPAAVDLDVALLLLGQRKVLGKHPDSGEEMSLDFTGKGLTLQIGNSRMLLGKDFDLHLTLDGALEVANERIRNERTRRNRRVRANHERIKYEKQHAKLAEAQKHAAADAGTKTQKDQ